MYLLARLMANVGRVPLAHSNSLASMDFRANQVCVRLILPGVFIRLVVWARRNLGQRRMLYSNSAHSISTASM